MSRTIMAATGALGVALIICVLIFASNRAPTVESVPVSAGPRVEISDAIGHFDGVISADVTETLSRNDKGDEPAQHHIELDMALKKLGIATPQFMGKVEELLFARYADFVGPGPVDIVLSESRTVGNDTQTNIAKFQVSREAWERMASMTKTEKLGDQSK